MTGECRQEVEVKAKKQTPPDPRVWCQHCRVRISPNEDQVASGDKVYHKHCFSKRSPVRKTKKK